MDKNVIKKVRRDLLDVNIEKQEYKNSLVLHLAEIRKESEELYKNALSDIKGWLDKHQSSQDYKALYQEVISLACQQFRGQISSKSLYDYS